MQVVWKHTPIRSFGISDAIAIHGNLGGGFKYFLFSTLFGEDFQFDEHIFQMGWFNHQRVMLSLLQTFSLWLLVKSWNWRPKVAGYRVMYRPIQVRKKNVAERITIFIMDRFWGQPPLSKVFGCQRFSKWHQIQSLIQLVNKFKVKALARSWVCTFSGTSICFDMRKIKEAVKKQVLFEEIYQTCTSLGSSFRAVQLWSTLCFCFFWDNPSRFLKMFFPPACLGWSMMLSTVSEQT